MKNHKTAAIILAAGGSSRMGQPKQLIKWQGKTFLNHIIEKIDQTNLSPIIIVLGAHSNKIKQTLVENSKISIVENTHWQEGLSTSVKLAIEKLPADIDSVIIFLVDQPQVRIETINSLVKKSENSIAEVIIPLKDNKKGNPILIKSSVLKHIDQLRGDKGFKQIIDQFSKDYIKCNDDSIFFDVDYIDDIKKLEKYI
jgi:molybdenum cofactor cytidylyltransferase